MLWFEADLYDQLQVIQVLVLLRASADRITLICIGEYRGIAHFGGLAELDPEQLAELPARAAVKLTPSALDHAARAWTAFRPPDPSALAVVARTPSPELRVVGEAFDRLGREYPSTRDGLALCGRRILAAIACGAPRRAAFGHAAARETRPFLGDTWCFDRMTRVIQAPVPLIATDPAADTVSGATSLRLTEAGHAVLDGRRDQVALNGVDRWIGGVRLEGDRPAWRCHEGLEAVAAVREERNAREPWFTRRAGLA